MGKIDITADKRQAGFTLVELAVVMIIIGLLIGGVLKGQELIANAQITSTSAATKGIDAATTTFRDTYNALPGDMINANVRLANCAAAPCVPGAVNGNGRVDSNAIGAAPTNENIAFWAQLGAADLMAGIDPIAGAGGNAWGANFPSSPVGGGFHMAYDAGGAALGGNPNARRGHYLILNNAPGVAPTGDALTALQAARIDRKLDDGDPTAGTVFPTNAGVGGAASCISGAGLYDESIANTTCDLFIRFQN